MEKKLHGPNALPCCSGTYHARQFTMNSGKETLDYELVTGCPQTARLWPLRLTLNISYFLFSSVFSHGQDDVKGVPAMGYQNVTCADAGSRFQCDHEHEHAFYKPRVISLPASWRTFVVKVGTFATFFNFNTPDHHSNSSKHPNSWTSDPL